MISFCPLLQGCLDESGPQKLSPQECYNYIQQEKIACDKKLWALCEEIPVEEWRAFKEEKNIDFKSLLTKIEHNQKKCQSCQCESGITESVHFSWNIQKARQSI
mgnify:CR=1 FL=1